MDLDNSITQLGKSPGKSDFFSSFTQDDTLDRLTSENIALKVCFYRLTSKVQSPKARYTHVLVSFRYMKSMNGEYSS